MKRTIIIIFISISILNYSCEQSPQKDEDSVVEHDAESIIHNIPEGDLEILEIDGCEYIIYQDARNANLGYGYMAHKGNCKNPVHIYRDTNQFKDLTKEERTDFNANNKQETK
jgi:hypothetical protein